MSQIATALFALAMVAPIVPANGASAQERIIIGDAVMQQDGTIVINMRRTADGINVTGQISYKIDNPHDKTILDTSTSSPAPAHQTRVRAWSRTELVDLACHPFPTS